ASQRATRRMAEINAAYAELTRADRASGRRSTAAGGGSGEDVPTAGAARRGGPPRPKATRPGTGRGDLSHNVRPRNGTFRAAGGGNGTTLRGHAPYRAAPQPAEPPRASTPTGPLARSRVRGFRPPVQPPLDEAAAMELPFGKFHGHTL